MLQHGESVCGCRKVLKQILVAELQPDETVDAVREARLLAKVCGLLVSQTEQGMKGGCVSLLLLHLSWTTLP